MKIRYVIFNCLAEFLINVKACLVKGALTLRMAFLFLASFALLECQDPDLTYSTTDEVVITGYLEKNQEQFSKFLEILRLSGNSGFLGAYGIYTCFAPTNDAIDLYLTKLDVKSVAEIPASKLKDIVRFHVIEDTISTSRFTDGKLINPTMYGQYLTTGAANFNGASFIRVNRQANIINSNVRTNNGIIHVIDNVLEPASLTLAQMVEQNPNYSILSQALKATGFYDMLNTLEENQDGTLKWYTLIAQTDEVFKSAGFDTYQDVEDRYSHLGDPKNSADSLYLFVAYRILPDIKYLADLITAPSHVTKAPLEVITTRLEGTNVLINSDLFRGVREPGSALNRDESDYSATNGVLHSALTNFTIKVRIPYAVYWDIADQPELRRMTNDFRKPGKTVVLTQGSLKEVTWGGASNTTITYNTNSATSTDPFVYGDRLTCNVRTGVIPWIEFTTPLLVKGKYKIWVCYRRTNYNDMQAFIDDEPLPRIFGLNPGPSYPGGVNEDEAEAQGWKTYTASGNTNWLGRLLGTIEIKTTDRHKFKVIGLTNRGGSTGNPFLFDMVHFIPIDKDQIWPKPDADGNLIDKP